MRRLVSPSISNGSRSQGVGSGEWGVGSGEWGVGGSGEWGGVRSGGEWGVGSGGGGVVYRVAYNSHRSVSVQKTQVALSSII